MNDPICGMAVDKRSPWRIQKDAETFYFCSYHCLKKFAGQNHLVISSQGTCTIPSRRWYTNKTCIVLGVLLSLSLLSYGMPFLIPFRESLMDYLRIVWWAVLLGIFLGGVIDRFIPREYISSILARRQKRTILRAVFLGFFMSACSHGILALSIELYKKGASTASVIAFLMASPWANLPLTLMLIGFFGISRALFIVISAVVVAVFTGLIYQLLESRGLVETNPNSVSVNERFSLGKDLMNRFRDYRFSRQQLAEDAKGIYDGARALGDMVLWWIMIGMGLASLAGAYVPAHIFHQYMGPTAVGMTVTLFAATVLEVCSEGTAPLAFEIFKQTGALGNSFVFLMAGVATDYTEIGLLWHNIGRKTAIWLPVITVPQIILLGICANVLF
ncbi:MAG: hypothetical protein A3D87_07940 [Omnitrophica WOR_2 bacterium RIFCSPHIGHO2_02_FULL_50_17]|nr:MAG: hypothetical protein A3D87_07940 [Omnitrophica WOR_2 bacterium RIFCSPHIGHO2_02_FULL_50_17]